MIRFISGDNILDLMSWQDFTLSQSTRALSDIHPTASAGMAQQSAPPMSHKMTFRDTPLATGVLPLLTLFGRDRRVGECLLLR
jgi:hypothetical protein